VTDGDAASDPQPTTGTATADASDQPSETAALTLRPAEPAAEPIVVRAVDPADLNKKPAPGVQRVTVEKGFTLWAIAREKYGEGVLYVRVFEANKDLIRDPDLIYPGQVFDLPE
jgi:nucleoid-associated protein YgaU